MTSPLETDTHIDIHTHTHVHSPSLVSALSFFSCGHAFKPRDLRELAFDSLKPCDFIVY